MPGWRGQYLFRVLGYCSGMRIDTRVKLHRTRKWRLRSYLDACNLIKDAYFTRLNNPFSFLTEHVIIVHLNLGCSYIIGLLHLAYLISI